MAFLDARALHDDPAGISFLREVIATPEGAVKPKGFGLGGRGRPSGRSGKPRKPVQLDHQTPQLAV